MTQLAIRPMALGEDAQVISLWQRCGLTRPWNDPLRDLNFAHGKQNADILVALDTADGGRIIASCMVGHDGHRGTLYYVAVDPEMQGQGYGRAMMRAGEGWLLGQGIWKVNLMIRIGNEAALQFYDRLGYQPSATTVVEKWIDPKKRGDA